MHTRRFLTQMKYFLTISKTNVRIRKLHHNIPFIHFYEKVTGSKLAESSLPELQKKHPNILKLSNEDIKYILQILQKFDITAEQACSDPHLFSMNPISMENYGVILQECQFTSIIPKYIIRYHTIVKSKTISQLKKDGILKQGFNLEEAMYEFFRALPKSQKVNSQFDDAKTNIVTVRMSVLERFLNWKLGVTNDEFKKYLRNYLPLRHRPYEDILESLHIAENDIKFNADVIRRNGFIISLDPVNTKLILENVGTLAGLDVREVMKLEPAIMKNNHQSLMQIKEILKEYNINDEMQYRCLRVFCMQPKTVRERLEHLSSLKEYSILSTNSRMLYMVVHEKKMINRLNKIQEAQKQCYSFNLLVSSSQVFNSYLNGFGAKVCGNDVGTYISASLNNKRTMRAVMCKLKRHKYWLHTALDVIADNIHMLKRDFSDDVIFDNCQILLYPRYEIEKYITYLMTLRKGEPTSESVNLDTSYNSIDFTRLTDSQILSLVLYEIEKGYHFSGDGIWDKSDSSREQSKVLHT